jgi:hypothetical protein
MNTLSLVIDQQQLHSEYNCIKPFDFGKALNRYKEFNPDQAPGSWH